MADLSYQQGGQPVAVVDESSGQALTVKPASTTAKESDPSVVVSLSPNQQPTFIAKVDAATLAANKNMMHVTNASGSSVQVQILEIYLRNPQTSGVTGVASAVELKRATSTSSATSITPLSFNTADTLNPSVTAGTGGTVTGEVINALSRRWISSDEWGPGALDMEGASLVQDNHHPMWKFGHGLMKPLTLRANETIFLKNITATNGSLDVEIVFVVV